MGSDAARRKRLSGREPPCRWLLVALLTALAAWLPARRAQAGGEAHILRIDPRVQLAEGKPIVTTVVDLVQRKRESDVTTRCAALSGDARLDCLSDRLEQPEERFVPLAWPKATELQLLIEVASKQDMPASLVSSELWRKSQTEPGVGTAWLIVIDAAANMESRLGDARAVAGAFIDAMGPQDTVNVVFIDDRAVSKDSKWLAGKAGARKFLDSVAKPYAKRRKLRALADIIKGAAQDAFGQLATSKATKNEPLHQAMVVLSSGSSGGDPEATGPGASALRQLMTQGRFPEGNKTRPKMPVPVISIWLPTKEREEIGHHSRQFMKNLANPEVGGFYSIVRGGQGGRGARIAKAVRSRFDAMHVIRWRVPCVAPAVHQTFKLMFDAALKIAGDAFTDVPMGIHPATWPLDVDQRKTRAAAKKHPLEPGGTVTIYGSFCWGSDKSLAELYLIDKRQPAPPSYDGLSIEDAQHFQQQAKDGDMVGRVVEADASRVVFRIPDHDRFINTKGERATARLVLYDTRAGRTSAITEDAILTLPAKQGKSWLLLGAIAAGSVLLLALGGFALRRSARPGRPKGPRPPPVVAQGGAAVLLLAGARRRRQR